MLLFQIVAPRFHLLTRPPQTEPFWVPPSHSADQTVGLLEATPLVSEDLVVQEFPYEGMQGYCAFLVIRCVVGLLNCE